MIRILLACFVIIILTQIVFATFIFGNSTLRYPVPTMISTNTLTPYDPIEAIPTININSTNNEVVNVPANFTLSFIVDNGSMYLSFISDRPIQISFKSQTTSSAKFPAGHVHIGNYIQINNNDTNAHITVAIAMSYASFAPKMNLMIQKQLKLYYAEPLDTTFTQVSNSTVSTIDAIVNTTVNHFSTWTIGYNSARTLAPAALLLIVLAVFPLLALYKKRKH